MTISRVLSDVVLTPEQRHVIQLAFNHALRKIGLVDRDDPLCALVAKKMIELHRRGVSDAVALAELPIREIDPPSP